MYKLPLSLAAAVAFSASIHSPRAMADTTQGTQVSFRLLCFEHRNNVTSAFAPGDDATHIPVPLFTSSFSEVMKARFTHGRAAFFIEEAQADGKMKKTIVAEGPLARSPRQAFVLMPSDEKKDGVVYRVLAFDDGEEAFPMGSTRVLNFSQFPVRLNIAGSLQPPIKPGGNAMIPLVKKVDDWNMFTAMIQFGVSTDQWVDVATQSWKASERKRDWVITLYDAETRLPTIRQYKDIPPWRRTLLSADERKSQVANP